MRASRTGKLPDITERELIERELEGGPSDRVKLGLGAFVFEVAVVVTMCLSLFLLVARPL
jgi:hypothetical protein